MNSHIYGVAHWPNRSPYGDPRLASAPYVEHSFLNLLSLNLTQLSETCNCQSEMLSLEIVLPHSANNLEEIPAKNASLIHCSSVNI